MRKRIVAIAIAVFAIGGAVAPAALSATSGAPVASHSSGVIFWE